VGGYNSDPSAVRRSPALLLDVFDELKRTKKREIIISQIRKAQAAPTTPNRTIPSDVKRRIWRREGGRVECGTNENFEYDHIIPVQQMAATLKETCSFYV